MGSFQGERNVLENLQGTDAGADVVASVGGKG